MSAFRAPATKLNDAILELSLAFARVDAELEAMADEWAAKQMPCCPSCAFAPRYGKLCDKADRQAAWLVKLLSKRGRDSDRANIRALAAEYIGAAKMARALERRVQPSDGALEPGHGAPAAARTSSR